MQPRKGQDIFIKAVKALSQKIRSEAEFLILGKEAYPDYIKTLQNLAKGVSEIQFLPATSNFEDYHKFVDDLDILVCPSREDPCPLVVIDAFMHSVPVIISDHVGQKQLLDNGKNGFVFKSENVPELTSILTKLIQEKIPDTLRAASRQIFEQNFSDKQFLDTLKQIMENTTCKK